MKITKPTFSLKTRLSWLFFIISFTFYTLMTYGGIRESDSEVVFRTAESLADKGTFAVSRDLETWRGFGLQKGTDGRKYSCYSPGEEIMLVPLIKIAQSVNKSRWYNKYRESIPISHYVGNGVHQFLLGVPPQDIEPHALRFLVSFFNILVCSVSVVLFLRLLEKLTHSLISAGFVTVLFAFGTLMLPYSGTLFSEPLATLFILISIYFLAEIDPACPALTPRLKTGLLISGASLGLSVATHITAILFVPFFLAYTIVPDCSYLAGNRLINRVTTIRYPINRVTTIKDKSRAIAPINYVLFFGAGLAVILAWLGYHNYVRFGSILETGRTTAAITKPKSIAPWRGLQGLLLSSGKGVIWYCPAIIPGIWFWSCFRKNRPGLSNLLLAAAIFRILFLASYDHWHGGFGLGPRLLIMIIPVLLIPLGYFVKDMLQANKISQLKIFCGFTLCCISQQIYFSLGEIFSFSHIVKMGLSRVGINAFQNDRIYLDWNLSPLAFLLEGKLGPFLLQRLPLNNYILLFLCVAAGAGLTCLFFAYLLRCYRRSAQNMQMNP